ncbi:alkaline phosphatase family protein [Speluncibacter jeojiensis]|uniref:alkaline phosphatase family protein n=1 Tax=Speluncibacter jeojiensis TaxID=2710754 RepID=UPI00240ED5F8|nr:alkaline phosphatase family protein [Rhodococcus sp. D2-41]
MTNNKRITAPHTRLTASAAALLAAAAAGTLLASAAPASAAPAEHAKTIAHTKTVIIGLDGTMLDHVKTANTPRLHRLLAEGTSGTSSIAGHPSISGPSWSTVLTGVWNTKHGVQDNSFAGANFVRYPSVYTRIETADPALRTESISTWGGIATIAGSGTPHADVVTTTPAEATETATDTATATAVARDIVDRGPDVVFTQLDQVDGAGHATGAASVEYRQALESVDVEVGRIVDAVDARARATGEKWTVLVTDDHGHKPSGGHGGQTPDETTTFVIARGPGYAPGVTRDDYRIADITPTVLANLGIAQPGDLDGRPLIKTASTPAAGSSTGSLSEGIPQPIFGS